MSYEDDDVPTNPGIGSPLFLEMPSETESSDSAPRVAASGIEDDDSSMRPTRRAPAPEQLDPTPRSVPLPPKLPRFADTTPELELSAVEDIDDRVTNPLLQNEIETWRPPASEPPARGERAPGLAVASAKASSIAPQELAARERSPKKSSTALITASIAVGMLALLGAGVLMRNADRPQSSSAAVSNSAPPATEVAPSAPPPQQPAPEPAATPEPIVVPAVVIDAQPESAPPVIATRTAPSPARAKAKPVAIAPQDLPEQPSRKAIGDSLAGLRSEIATCAGGKPGVAELDLTLNGNGSVSHAIVGGDFAGTPQGSCIARTLRRAHFTPFSQAKFRVLYRLML